MREGFIDVSGVPERFKEPLKALVEVLRERAKGKEKGQSGTAGHIPQEISLEGLSEDEKEFVRLLVEFFRERQKGEAEEVEFKAESWPLGVKGNLSREEIYEDYLDHKVPPLHNGERSKGKDGKA